MFNRNSNIWPLFTIFVLIASICVPSFSVIRKEGIYESLRGYVSELANVIHDVSAGIEKLGKGIRNVEDFLDATVDELCLFECPKGEKSIQNPDYIPTSNGCGSFGLEDFITTDMLPMDEFVGCCDGHDICYSMCGQDKDECDLKFKKCLYRKCSAEKDSVSKFKHKGCQAGAKILYTATTTLGCKSYINSQKESCICSKPDGTATSQPKSPRDEF